MLYMEVILTEMLTGSKEITFTILFVVMLIYLAKTIEKVFIKFDGIITGYQQELKAGAERENGYQQITKDLVEEIKEIKAAIVNLEKERER